jgi:uncharacterized protein (TIGR04255 family)
MSDYRIVPLIELIAELRWEMHHPLAMAMGGSTFPPGVQQVQIPYFDHSANEQFASLFSSFCQKEGVLTVERLQPPGFPMMPGQVSHRFRPANKLAELYQVGPGVFTANAIPPYNSWRQFRGFLEQGVSALLSSRPDSDKESSIKISVQYIDAFDMRFWKGKTAQRFVEDTLGFAITVPPVLESIKSEGEEIKTNLQMSLGVRGGFVMNCQISEGVANGQPCVLMHTNVVASGSVAPDLKEIMSSLDSAQEIQHRLFEGVTKDLHAFMEGGV